MAIKQRFTLSDAERFSIWGRTVGSVTVAGKWASLYEGTRPLSAKYIGSVEWENVPQVANLVRGYRAC
jgi:hypothetical protein